jgi:predicted nucleic acid-binding protein
MILVDTSVWVEYDRATGSPADRALTDLITHRSDDIAVTEPVLAEVLAGARSDGAARRLRALLTSFGWLSADAQVDFEAAARIYRLCRAAGVTPRGLFDCLIASVALRTDSEILCADRDFTAMAEVVRLRTTAF